MEGATRDAVGISLQILATFLAAAAYALQKLAHNKISHARDLASAAVLLDQAAAGSSGGGSAPPASASVYRSPLWLAGFVFMFVVALIDVYCFSLLDQSKLAAFGAVTMAWNVVLSALVLKERFTRADALAVTIIGAGTVLALSASAPTSKNFTLEEILALLQDDAVYAYSAIMGGIILVGTVLVERQTRLPRERWGGGGNWLLAVGAPILGGCCMGFTGYAVKALSSVIFNGDWRAFTAFPVYAYLVLAAVAVSGQVRAGGGRGGRSSQ